MSRITSTTSRGTLTWEDGIVYGPAELVAAVRRIADEGGWLHAHAEGEEILVDLMTLEGALLPMIYAHGGGEEVDLEGDDLPDWWLTDTLDIPGTLTSGSAWDGPWIDDERVAKAFRRSSRRSTQNRLVRRLQARRGRFYRRKYHLKQKRWM